MTDHPRPPCDALTAAGEPCRGTALPGRPQCFAHDESTAEARAAGRERGGRNRSTVARRYAEAPEPVRDMLGQLREMLDDLRAGRIEPARASAGAALGRAVLHAWDLSVVEDRLVEVERHLATIGRPVDRPGLRVVGE